VRVGVPADLVQRVGRSLRDESSRRNLAPPRTCPAFARDAKRLLKLRSLAACRSAASRASGDTDIHFIISTGYGDSYFANAFAADAPLVSKPLEVRVLLDQQVFSWRGASSQAK
jgi:hypothetical protein